MPFRDVAGHGRLIELVARAAARGTLPPSLLFAGPEGVGKRQVAQALAQFLNCLAPRDDDACGACAACRRIARGVHADVMVIEPGDSGSIKVDQVRDAVERSAYRPFEGRRRVVIVDDAEALEPGAQNALLKTLEEPPSASVFVLVTSMPDVLLPTVLSRCQRLRFGRLPPAEIAGELIAKHGYAEGEARAAASVADGSLGRALQERSDEFAEARDAAGRALQALARGGDPRRRLDSAKELAPIGRVAENREELSRRLRALSSLLRDLEILATRADERWLVNVDLKGSLQGLLGTFDRGRTLRAFSAVDRALAALERNASPKIVADWLAFQL